MSGFSLEASIAERAILREFVPAIYVSEGASAPVRRLPRWYILHYATNLEKVLLRLLKFIKLPYQLLKFREKVGRGPAVDRYWFPGGYLFVEFDVELDAWGQVLRMPGALELLGSPTPLPDEGLGSLTDLVARCPYELPKGVVGAIKLGTEVRVLRGPYEGSIGRVIEADKRSVVLPLVMFGAIRSVRFDAMNVAAVK